MMIDDWRAKFPPDFPGLMKRNTNAEEWFAFRIGSFFGAGFVIVIALAVSGILKLFSLF